jgi:hypothetical protein
MIKFIEKHPISGPRTMPEKQLLNDYKDRVPSVIINFWETYGFGKHSDGLFEIINPNEYEEIMSIWLGVKNQNRVPLIMTAFGDIFYHRKLTDTEEDISFIDVHYKNIAVVNWNSLEFFETDLCKDSFLIEYMDLLLFEEALNKIGPLEPGEIYSFVPALALGGAKELQYIDKANGIMHLRFLYQF